MNIAPTYQNLFRIGAPIMLFNFVQSAIGFTDTIFLGRVSIVDFSACGIMSIYYLIFVMIGFGISRGAQILIARRVGEQRYDEVGKITDHLFILEMVTALGLFIFLHLTSSFIIPWFIQSEEILTAGWEYLRYRSFGIFFSLFAFVLLALYSGVGRTKAVIYVTITLAVVNIILNYSLIFGKFGLPEMRIAGAGLASTIAEIVSGIVGFIYLMTDPLRKRLQLFNFKKLSRELFVKMIRISTPLVLQFLMGLGGWFVFFTFLENFGKQALAVSVVLRWLYSFYMIPSIGLSASVNTVVSNTIGQGKYKQAILGMRKAVTLSVIMTAVLVLTLYIIPYPIAAIFTNDVAIIEASQEQFVLLSSFLMMCAVSNVVFNSLMGTGATQISLVVVTLSVILYLGYAFSIINIFQLGLGYAWFAEFVYWFLIFLFSILYFYTGRWRNQEV